MSLFFAREAKLAPNGVFFILERCHQPGENDAVIFIVDGVITVFYMFMVLLIVFVIVSHLKLRENDIKTDK